MLVRTLIVVVEAGAAAYIAPYIRLLEGSKSRKYHVLATEVAARKLNSLHVTCHTIIQRDTKECELREVLNGQEFEVFLLSATGSQVERAALRIGKSRGARTVCFIDAYTPFRPRFTHNGELSFSDEILVIDDEMSVEAMQIGVSKDSVKIVGQPAWENLPSLPKVASKNILFVDQPIERYYGKALGYDESKAWKLVCDCCFANPTLVDRIGYAVHPESSINFYERELNSSNARLSITLESDIYNSISEYGIVLGMFSSFLVEAFLQGRKVISVQPHYQRDDLCVLSKRGLINKVSTARELSKCLAQHSNRSPNLRFQRSFIGSSKRLQKALGTHE